MLQLVLNLGPWILVVILFTSWILKGRVLHDRLRASIKSRDKWSKDYCKEYRKVCGLEREILVLTERGKGRKSALDKMQLQRDQATYERDKYAVRILVLEMELAPDIELAPQPKPAPVDGYDPGPHNTMTNQPPVGDDPPVLVEPEPDQQFWSCSSCRRLFFDSSPAAGSEGDYLLCHECTH